jgi:predicted nuclease with TOPRIM domain
MEEPRTTEVIHSITYAEDTSTSEVDLEPKLEGVDLDNAQELADYYMAKSGVLDSDQLEVEKKEKELREDIRQVVENKEDLIEYLCNLHASIEVMEERIYELELKAAQKEKQSVESLRKPQTPGLGGGLSQLPFGLI